MNHVEQRSVSTELRTATTEDGSRTVTGLIPYNSPSVDLGGFTELLAPGCFSAALEGTADVLALRDHDAKLLLGRTKSKTLTLTDSPEGLRYSIKLPKTTAAADLAESIDRGDLDSTSFGFVAIEDKWAVSGENVIRTLLSVELLECSPCSFPAYPASAVSVRSCPAEIRTRMQRRDSDISCTCPCTECVDGDCTNCSDIGCECDGCDCTDNSEFLRTYMHVGLMLRVRSPK